jgi:hypothetical protein
VTEQAEQCSFGQTMRVNISVLVQEFFHRNRRLLRGTSYLILEKGVKQCLVIYEMSNTE